MPAQPLPQRKLLSFYLLTVALSLLAALLVIEVVMRNMAYTVAVNMGNKAHERWLATHWKPLNELGLRDYPLQRPLDPATPRLYFLGDSFSAGAGVDFEQTFYFRAAWQGGLGYNPFNLSRPGASTRTELAEIERFDAQTQRSAAVVVQQYFVNDIEDYVRMPPRWQPPAWLAFAARHLESAELLLTWRFNQEWLQHYKQALEAAYADPDLMARHLRDLARLHDYIRGRGGRVVFLVFPALSPDTLQKKSEQQVRQLRGFFAGACRDGDVLVDATPSVTSLSERERVVSILDPHPSARLHGLIAERIRQAVRLQPPPPGQVAAYESCESLRRQSPRR